MYRYVYIYIYISNIIMGNPFQSRKEGPAPGRLERSKGAQSEVNTSNDSALPS